MIAGCACHGSTHCGTLAGRTPHQRLGHRGGTLAVYTMMRSETRPRGRRGRTPNFRLVSEEKEFAMRRVVLTVALFLGGLLVLAATEFTLSYCSCDAAEGEGSPPEAASVGAAGCPGLAS